MVKQNAAGTSLDRDARHRTVDLGAVILEHGPALLAYARVLLVNGSDAEDLVQATFEIALRKGDQLRSIDSMRAWLFRIQTREALRLRRRVANLVRLGGHDEPSITGVEADHVAVRQAIDALPVRTRAAVALHHMAGMSVPDTATTMGISPNSVKTLIRIGMATIREELGSE